MYIKLTHNQKMEQQVTHSNSMPLWRWCKNKTQVKQVESFFNLRLDHFWKKNRGKPKKIQEYQILLRDECLKTLALRSVWLQITIQCIVINNELLCTWILCIFFVSHYYAENDFTLNLPLMRNTFSRRRCHRAQKISHLNIFRYMT